MINSSKAIDTLYKPRQENYFMNLVNNYIFKTINKFAYTKIKEQTHIKKLEVLNNLISATNSAEDLDILYAKTLNATIHLMNFDCGAIYLVEKDKNKANIHYYQSMKKETLNSVSSLAINKSPFIQVYEHGVPFVSSDYGNYMYGDLCSHGFQCCIIIPLIHKSEILGSLNLLSKEKITFSDEEKDLLISIGKEVGTAINRLIVEEKAKESLREKELLLYELNRKNEELKELSVTDGLTSLYNHKYIIENLKEEINKSQNCGCPLSIIMFDIDHFKKVNDTYGHLFGDHVLKTVSNTVLNLYKNKYTIGRYGGEEFLMLLPNTNLSSAFSLAENLRKNISNLEWSKSNFSVTASFGIKQYDGSSTSNIINDVDTLLYKAKQEGRNKCCH